MSVTDYTSKIKEICDSLTSIDLNVEEDEIVQVCFRELAFRTVVYTRESTLSFFDLQSMLFVEENHAGVSTSTRSKIGPGLVADEASRRAMEAPDMSKKEGIVAMPTILLDPPEAGGSRRRRKLARKTRRGMLVLCQERPQGNWQ